MILVTGASGGVGREVCLRLAARGEHLLLSARDRLRMAARGGEERA